MARKSPVLWLTPRSLPASSISAGLGKKLSYFGYEFEVPWDDLDDSKTKIGANSTVLRFHSGYAIKFTSLPPREFVNGILEHMNKDSLRQIYGDGPLQSDYAMWNSIADATPDKVTLFSSRKETVGIPMLLLIKAIASPEESGIYSIQTSDFKGFQWGDPQAHPKHIVADLFADDGRLEIAFIGPGNGKPLAISQPEINRVLQTVHKINTAEGKIHAERATASVHK